MYAEEGKLLIINSDAPTDKDVVISQLGQELAKVKLEVMQLRREK